RHGPGQRSRARKRGALTTAPIDARDTNCIHIPKPTRRLPMHIHPSLALLCALACAPALAADPAEAALLPDAPGADAAAAPGEVARPARIRLFGQNGVALTMYTSARCEDEYDEEISASGAVSHGFKTLFGKKRPNETIGIPETESTRTLASRDKL